MYKQKFTGRSDFGGMGPGARADENRPVSTSDFSGKAAKRLIVLCCSFTFW